MRKHIQSKLKKDFRFALLQYREELGFGQEEMAHKLMMATRSYIALEHGDSCCNVVTFILFLLYVCPDPAAFLKELHHTLEKAREAA